jgi:hypothetical protein
MAALRLEFMVQRTPAHPSATILLPAQQRPMHNGETQDVYASIAQNLGDHMPLATMQINIAGREQSRATPSDFVPDWKDRKF